MAHLLENQRPNHVYDLYRYEPSIVGCAEKLIGGTVSGGPSGWRGILGSGPYIPTLAL